LLFLDLAQGIALSLRQALEARRALDELGILVGPSRGAPGGKPVVEGLPLASGVSLGNVVLKRCPLERRLGFAHRQPRLLGALAQAIAFLMAMAGNGPAQATPYAAAWYLTPELALALAAGALGSMPLIPALARWRNRIGEAGSRTATVSMLDLAAASALMLVFFVSITQMAARTYNPFIYFRF
jgi:hypothetical protein